MSDNKVTVPEDEQAKMMAQQAPARKWSVSVMGYNVPYWLILVVVIVVVVLLFKMNVGGVCDKVRLCSETRAKMSAASRLPVAAATGASVMSNSSSNSSDRSAAVRSELRRLFEQF